MMWKCLFYGFVVAFGLAQWLIPGRSLHAASCDRLHIVLPNNRGGTFYLSPDIDEATSRYPRAGYLPVGTLLKLTRPGEVRGTHTPNTCGGDSDFSRCFRDSENTLTAYLRFTASNGASGWVAQGDTKSLDSWITAETGVSQCPSESQLLIPIGATDSDAMRIYRIEQRNNGSFRSTNPVKTVTRTAPLMVMMADPPEDVWLLQPEPNEKNSAKRFLPVVWYEPLEAGGWRKRTDTVVSNTDRNTAFTIIPLPEDGEDYRVFERQEIGRIEELTNAISRFGTQIDPGELGYAFVRECIPFNTAAELSTPHIVEAVIPANLSATFEFRPNQAYEMIRIIGVVGDENEALDVFKVKNCPDQSLGFSNKAFEAEAVSFLINDLHMALFQGELLQEFGAHFRRPIASGIQIEQAYMLELRPQEPSVTDPFTAYSKLQIFLNRIMSQGGTNLRDEEKERLLYFMANTIVAPVQ